MRDDVPPQAPLDYPQVYAQLHQLARQMRKGEAGDTLNTTALVHEAWLKVSARGIPLESQRQFLGTAAMAMRQILMDHARYQQAAKRDVRQRIESEEADATLYRMGDPADARSVTAAQVLALDFALTKLDALEPDLARFVELRYFTGLTLNELALHHGVTIRTATRTWTRARTLLKLWLSGSE